ncbi:MAG: aspartate-semialdehyde dehydrogenase, partial [Candidatus Omnitrophica bacterium]|nr:aspartate-semialdehyde dehydrogenase [Candidatus Omnitrophota bacterium]
MTTTLKGKKTYSVAIMGATGAVGEEMLKIVEERKFPVKSLKLLASQRSKGKKYTFHKETHTVEELTEKSFQGVDIVLSSAGGSISKKFVPFAIEAGAVVIDNTSAFRMEPDVPLVVPEVNGEAAKNRPRGIIANPNCSTI